MTPEKHGSDIAKMLPAEYSGYCKAMLDCIDWLYLQAREERDKSDAAIRRQAVEALVEYRNAKLNAGAQVKTKATE